MRPGGIERSSIRVRLTLWYSLVLLLGLAILGGFLWLSLKRELFADVDKAMTVRMGGLADYLRIESTEHGGTLEEELKELAHSLPSDYEMVVLKPGGQALYSTSISSTFTELAARGAATASEWGWFFWQGGQYRVLRRQITLSGTTYRLLIAAPTEQTEHALGKLAYLLLIAIPGVVLAAGLGGYWISSRALAPVDAITRKARSIGIENLSERLPVPRTRDEIQRLTETWNDMLARLETAVNRISQFTSDASHELRTPLAFVRATSEIALRKTRTEGEYRDSLERICGESERMTKLVEDLLFLARADAGPIPVPMETIDIRMPVRAVCGQIATLASAKGIRLRCEESEFPVAVRGNDSALRRMLTTLLENALKYTPEGGDISVRVDMESGQARVAVEDTGIGIREEAMPHIFERFYRADASRSRDSGGYGLGLSIAQAIAQQHSGLVMAQPKSGRGALLRVTIPVSV